MGGPEPSLHRESTDSLILCVSVFTYTYISTAPSGPPTSFESAVLNATAISFTWDPPLPQYRNGIIRRYLLVLESEEFESNIGVYSTDTNITVTNLHPYTLYECTISAETVMIGPESDTELARTHEAGIQVKMFSQIHVYYLYYLFDISAPSGPPEELHSFPLSSTVIEISWYPPRSEYLNGLLRQYFINITTIITGDTWQLTTVDTNATVGSLHPFYSYSITVAAETISLGPFTSPVIVETPEDGKSGLATNNLAYH